jgi:hypothetical protein
VPDVIGSNLCRVGYIDIVNKNLCSGGNHVGTTTSALAGDPDLNLQVFRTPRLKPRSAQVSATR